MDYIFYFIAGFAFAFLAKIMSYAIKTMINLFLPDNNNYSES